MPQPRRRVALALPLVAAALLALVGCTPADPDDRPGGSDPDDERPVVLTTFTVLADIARNVAGDELRVESLTRVGAEIHGYEPTPGDLRRASEADLILDNGLGLEAWFARFIDGLDVPHVVVSDGVDPIPIAGSDAPNPHAWMSPLNAQSYARTIAAAFAELDPAGAAGYAERAEAYALELQQVHDDLVTELAALPDTQRVLVSCEGAFSYLTRDAGLAEVYIWPVNAEQQATPQQIASVIEYVDTHRVPAVFCESTVSDRPMQQVVEATGARFGGVLYVDSLSEADGPVPSYLELIRHDVDTIVAGLTGEGP